jgi:hypothetical protein
MAEASARFHGSMSHATNCCASIRAIERSCSRFRLLEPRLESRRNDFLGASLAHGLQTVEAGYQRIVWNTYALAPSAAKRRLSCNPVWACILGLVCCRLGADVDSPAGSALVDPACRSCRNHC